MDEIRAALALARKDIRVVSRYRLSVASQIFTPLYQGVLPALLFGASFAVGGRVVGLEKTIGTADLAGFIFFGGVISGLVATAFWAMGMSFRNEMENGTLEPTWLTPTSKETLVIGRALGGMVFFVFGQVVLFAIGIAFFGLHLRWEMLYAVPALVLASVALVGVAHLLAGIVLTIRDANLFIDCTNFLFATASGVAFPILLPARRPAADRVCAADDLRHGHPPPARSGHASVDGPGARVRRADPDDARDVPPGALGLRPRRAADARPRHARPVLNTR